MITKILKQLYLLYLHHTSHSYNLLELSLVKALHVNTVLPLIDQKAFPYQVSVSSVGA